jgi:hypothetical protein
VACLHVKKNQLVGVSYLDIEDIADPTNITNIDNLLNMVDNEEKKRTCDGVSAIC